MGLLLFLHGAAVVEDVVGDGVEAAVIGGGGRRVVDCADVSRHLGIILW